MKHGHDKERYAALTSREKAIKEKHKGKGWKDLKPDDKDEITKFFAERFGLVELEK